MKRCLHIFCAAGGATLGLALAVLFMEAASVSPRFVYEPATVRKVVPNPPWRYVGQTQMTLIRFADGYDTDIGGNRGEPGDTILAPRQRGTKSLFGILASTT